MMKYNLLLIFCFFMCIANPNLLAQEVRSVLYNLSSLNEISPNYSTVRYSRLVFNDSLSYFYFFASGTTHDPLRKTKIYGKKIEHHALHYNITTDTLGSVVDYNVKKPYLIVSKRNSEKDWQLLPDRKEILGHVCGAALSVSKKGDSSLAFYALDIPFAYGPSYYLGLPGLVLEYFDQSNNMHFQAKKSEEGPFNIVWPSQLERVDKNQSLEIHGKRKAFRHP